MEKISFNDKRAVDLLKSGEVIAFPTETVYGLGVRYDNLKSYEKLISVKNRPENKVFTLMVGDLKNIEKFAVVDEKIKRICNKYLPGPLTIILNAKREVPSYVTSKTKTIGIRCPALKPLRELINSVGVPLLVPSANKSGEKPCENLNEVINVFENDIKAVIKDDTIKSDIPSTIVDFSEEGKIKLVRSGGIEFKELEELYYE